jgi:predicted Holliday junction resolvase-like endonuclease
MEQNKESSLLIRSAAMLMIIKNLLIERLVSEGMTMTATEEHIFKDCNKLIEELREETINGPK